MTAGQIRAVQQAAVTPAQRLAVALAAVHAARPRAIRELTLDDIDLPNRRITITGHRQPLGEFTRHALLAWLGYRRATWPDTGNRHVLISRISALGTEPVSPDYLDKHQLRGISLEHIRRDRILQEALATGADSLHLTLVFNIDHTNAMAYADAARSLLSGPAEQALLPPPGMSTKAPSAAGKSEGRASRWPLVMGRRDCPALPAHRTCDLMADQPGEACRGAALRSRAATARFAGRI
jgi:hypothetical protein